MKTACVMFAGGLDRYRDGLRRLKIQANEMNVFDHVHSFMDKDLKADPEFWPRHGAFVEANKRGYGYMIWKPYLIQKIMNTMENGDIILYVDAGCELDKRKRDHMMALFDKVKIGKLIASVNSREIEYNKIDIMVFLEMMDHDLFYSHQIQTGAIMFLVCEETRGLVDKWYSVAHDYHMIDDSPSIHPRKEEFVEHRHDQSIFSLLVKKMGLDKQPYMRCIEEAVDYVRNLSSVSILNDNPNFIPQHRM